MIEIRLHPSGRLFPESSNSSAGDNLDFSKLKDVFHSDWREGLFSLAADTDIDTAHLSPTVRFWRDIAANYLTKLCQIPGSESEVEVEPPSDSDFATWVLTAPPMAGGEYLSAAMIEGVWSALTQWGTERIAAAGGVESFLKKRATGWNRVGRVTFHLAENKKDEARPFAFMASFTTGIGTGGKLKHLPLRKALEMYAGTGNKQALIKLLSPVQKAAERCEWVQELVESGEIYSPMAWTPERAYQMLRTATALEESGLSVRLPDWWKKRPRPHVSVTIGEKKRSSLGALETLDFDIAVAMGGEPLSQAELNELLSGGDGLVLFKGKWIEVDSDRLQQALDHWKDIEAKAENGELSFIEGMRLLAGAPVDLKQTGEVDEERSWAHVSAGKAMREMLSGLREPSRLEPLDTGNVLNATLRPYQRDGVSWLHFLTELGLGACLADDMGLGKTLQTLALLACRSRGRKDAPSLLIIPASLLGNWRSESELFTPTLKLLILHPSETDKATMARIEQSPEKQLAGYDLVITTYSMTHRIEWLADIQWHLVILDEAQAIKNHTTRQSRAVRKFKANSRIALTGTPIENRIGDLWSLFDFLNPGLLGSATVFKRFVKSLEDRPRDTFGPLRKLVGPYILRRLKTDRNVISDLPDKTETIRYCSLTKEQVKCYKQTVDALADALKTKTGMERRGLVLQTLMRLKQICNHPSQFNGDAEYAPGKSGKFTRIGKICEELAERQEKALVFTQFREIIPALDEHLARVFGRPGLVLHGGTNVKKRKNLVDRFQQEDGPPFFILSLKAGGTGLNLTAASHVIHFDRWWNPAVENQATDRTFRIGQKKNVLVHKFVTTGTIEERIDEMINEKRELAEQLLSGSGEIKLTELADDELMQLVRLDVSRATR